MPRSSASLSGPPSRASSLAVAAGIFARKVNSVPLGICLGLAVGCLFAFLVAYMQHGYYLRIMLPGSIVGMIVGFATQRFGAAPATTPATR